jgi:hypothetical protein
MKIKLKMNTPAIFLFIALLLLLGTACNKNFSMQYDSLCLGKKTYTGNELRIDGYFFSGDETRLSDVWLFYRDGTFLNWGGVSEVSSAGDSFGFVEEQLTLEANLNLLRRSRTGWGVFEIDGNNIKVVHWFCSEGRCRAFVREGVILNDTTFKITKTYRCDGSGERSVEQLFNFRSFSPKPDSTNVFIK